MYWNCEIESKQKLNEQSKVKINKIKYKYIKPTKK